MYALFSRRSWQAGFLLAGLVAGCSGAPRDPVGLFGPRDTGQTGTGGNLSALVGRWRATLFLTLDGDVQSWVTTWRFDAAGGCLFRRETTSVAEGVTRVRERACTWVVGGSTLTATFTDIGEPYPMPWSFKGVTPAVLILEGIEYLRLVD